ncbi:MAG: hypothetical protein CMC65_07400 [Flavobacteriaceae bacterium]|nr:hypothetical protein [Flavobacteriaceae bacterium]|tara:strand:+ start:4124 stop:4345 length:222 start_codon:yes stop_codon:yes gene_type:complete
MKKIVRKIRSWFVPTPTVPFTWSVEDFEAAKKYAKTQPHPENNKQSLWEYAQRSSFDDSSYILARINEHLDLK